jgi:hypothetical protein
MSSTLSNPGPPRKLTACNIWDVAHVSIAASFILESLKSYRTLLATSLDTLRLLGEGKKQSVDVSVIRKDYELIIQLLAMNVTKLSLAMKPPVTWEAIELLAKDLETQVLHSYRNCLLLTLPL